MIQAQAMAARMACARMTTLDLRALHDSVERACRLAGRRLALPSSRAAVSEAVA
jgi:hypothetical protein